MQEGGEESRAQDRCAHYPADRPLSDALDPASAWDTATEVPPESAHDLADFRTRFVRWIAIPKQVG